VPVVDLSRARWRKSSRSGSGGQDNCVEVAVVPARWRTSSRSGTGGQANCVEVAVAGAATAVRDSKNPSGPVLVFAAPAWRSFLDAARGGLDAGR
jgi:hypothetical protein